MGSRIWRGSGGFGLVVERFLGVGWTWGILGWDAAISRVRLEVVIVDGIDMHACNYGQREYSSKPRKNASGCWA